MAATQNEVLAALGSSLRISDDATYDDVRSAADGVDKWRLYFSSYNMDNPLMDGVEVDPDHPYDKLYTERFSHYGGASIYAVDASGHATSTLPAAVSPVVYGHATTYSVDVDQDGLRRRRYAQVCLCRKRQPPDGHGHRAAGGPWHGGGLRCGLHVQL